MACTQDSSSKNSQSRQAALGSMQQLGIFVPELRLENQPSSFHGCKSSVLDLPDHFSSTTSSSNYLTLKYRTGEGNDDKLNAVEDFKTAQFGKWRGKFGNWRYGTKRGESTIGQNQSVQSKETKSVSVKISMWKKLLAMLISRVHKIRPARLESTTWKEFQQTDCWPKHESIQMLGPKQAFKLNKSSSFQSHPVHISCTVKNHPAVPLWKRRNEPEPLPLDSTKIKMNRNNIR